MTLSLMPVRDVLDDVSGRRQSIVLLTLATTGIDYDLNVIGR